MFVFSLIKMVDGWEKLKSPSTLAKELENLVFAFVIIIFFLIYIRYLNYNLCAGGRKQGRMYDYWFAEGLPTFKCMILVFANYTCIKST